MCMLWIYNNSKCRSDEYSLILANVRDENLNRPTKTAHFWSSDMQILGGMDMKEGLEGGTWFAMSTSGKVGVLLNVLQPFDYSDLDKKPRGFLVPNFLKSNSNGPTYLQSIASFASIYQPFKLVTLDISGSPNRTLVSQLCNSPEVDFHVYHNAEIFCFGNNIPNKPWLKMIESEQRYKSIAEKYKQVSKRNALIRQIFGMLNNKTYYYPDPYLLEQAKGYDTEFIRRLSSVFVHVPMLDFGT
ncbi:hypothetical protein B4U79_11411, partial [Dinothrombium tinctorium]